MKSSSIVYLLWASLTIGVGIYILHQVVNPSNPNSIVSKYKQLNESIDEYP